MDVSVWGVLCNVLKTGSEILNKNCYRALSISKIYFGQGRSGQVHGRKKHDENYKGNSLGTGVWAMQSITQYNEKYHICLPDASLP